MKIESEADGNGQGIESSNESFTRWKNGNFKNCIVSCQDPVRVNGL